MTLEKWWKSLPTVRDQDPESCREIEEEPVGYAVAATCYLAATPRWIPVEERLPEESGRYQVIARWENDADYAAHCIDFCGSDPEPWEPGYGVVAWRDEWLNDEPSRALPPLPAGKEEHGDQASQE